MLPALYYLVEHANKFIAQSRDQILSPTWRNIRFNKIRDQKCSVTGQPTYRVRELCYGHCLATLLWRSILRFGILRTANLLCRLDPSGGVAILTDEIVENETSTEPTDSGESAVTNWVSA